MPRVTFFNLPEDKKQKLISAAKKEFSRVPLFDALISNIVKSAEIPRGSFYQYFEDKEDAFFFILNDLVVKNNSEFVRLLKKYEGDIFDTLIEFYQFIIEEDENFHFFKNIFLNMTYQIDHTFSKTFSDRDSKEHFKRISSLININTMNVSNDKELSHVMQIITAVTLRNFVEKYAKNLTIEEAVNNYKIEIHLLKKGLSKPASNEGELSQ